MRALHEDQNPGRGVLEYRSVVEDWGEGREKLAGAAWNLGLLLGMLTCVTAFLFLMLAGLGMMVMAVSGLEWFGLGVCCVLMGLGALFAAGWCLDSMR